MDYSGYNVEDFVTDEYFIKWVKSRDEASNSFWTAWISKNPQQSDTVQRAREIILLMEFTETPAPEGKFLEIWQNIVQAKDPGRSALNLHVPAASQPGTRRSTRRYYSVAAAIMVLVLAGSIVFFYQHRTITLSTAYGESRTLFLPDSTKVTLNANTSLRYAATGFSEDQREVWLDGEAFFSVVSKNDHQNFLVHTKELQVEVLGTRFNVNSRRGKSKVILEEGKVKLGVPAGERTTEVVMEPGEMVEFSTKSKNLNKEKVDVENYTSWRQKRFVFVSTSLEEIGLVLEDNYGYDVVFQHEELKEKKFTGSFSVDDVEELFHKLNKLFDMDIQQEGNRLILKDN